MRFKVGTTVSGRGRRLRCSVAGVAVLALVAALGGCTSRWESRLVSVNASGTARANDQSRLPVLSPDGTKVVFESYGSNLGPIDTNETTDLYVRDLETGVTELVSVNAAGTDAGNDRSYFPQFSPDGSTVMFASNATDLTGLAVSGPHANLYVRNLETSETTLVSISHDGTDGGNGETTWGEFSPDGTRIAFSSGANNLLPGGVRGALEHDLATGVTTQLVEGSGLVYAPSGDAAAYYADDNVHLLDLATGMSTTVSAGLPGVSRSGRMAFSPDSGKLAFLREPGDGRVLSDIFVHDRVTGTTRLVTTGIGGTVSSNGISQVIGFHPADSHRLLFTSRASNLVASDTNSSYDVFVRDVAAGATSLVSVNASGGTSGGSSPFASWMGEGGRVAFVSSSRDMGVTDTNGAMDVFIRDTETGAVELVSSNAAGDAAANGKSGEVNYYNPGPTMYELSASADGTRIAFGSDADDLDTNDSPRDWPTGDHDVYVADIAESS